MITASSLAPGDRRQRRAPTPWGLLRRRRDAAVGRAEDARRHEDDQLAALLEHFLLLEEPADERHVAEDRHLAHGVLIGRRGHAADDEALTFLDEDECFRFTLVDRGRVAGVPEVDHRAARVVLDDDQHLDLGDVALANDGRRYLELEQRFLELDLRAGGADGRVRDLFTERHDRLVVLDGDDFRASEGACLALLVQRLQRDVDVELLRDDAERDAAGRQRSGVRQGADRQVDEIAAERQAGLSAHGQTAKQTRSATVQERQCRVPRVQVLNADRIDDVRSALDESRDERHRLTVRYRRLEALSDERERARPTSSHAAPLDADLLQRAAIEDLHPRFDLHLGQLDVEALLDQLLDAFLFGGGAPE